MRPFRPRHQSIFQETLPFQPLDTPRICETPRGKPRGVSDGNLRSIQGRNLKMALLQDEINPRLCCQHGMPRIVHSEVPTDARVISSTLALVPLGSLTQLR